jgi:hypothetical protein
MQAQASREAPMTATIPYVKVPCMAVALDEDGEPVILPSGCRLVCGRTQGHFPRTPHADCDDDGNLVEWTA